MSNATDALILGIETSGSRVGCAIGNATSVLAARESAKPRWHAESLVPQIAEVIAEVDASAKDINVIAVDVGPGLYTGIRVGITTAITMAHVLNPAMVAVTSWELVAHAVSSSLDYSSEQSERIDVVLDARRGEVFHAAFATELQPIGKPSVSDPVALATELSAIAPTTHLVGEGVALYQDVFDQAGFNTENALFYPSAESTIGLACAALENGKTNNIADIKPLYLRAPDAKIIKT